MKVDVTLHQITRTVIGKSGQSDLSDAPNAELEGIALRHAGNITMSEAFTDWLAGYLTYTYNNTASAVNTLRSAFPPNESHMKFIPIMENYPLLKYSKLKSRNTELNISSAERRICLTVGRSNDITRHLPGIIALREFHSLRSFKYKRWDFAQHYTSWRKQEILNGMTPASV